MKRFTCFMMAMVVVHCFTLLAFDGPEANLIFLWPGGIGKNKFQPPTSDKYATCFCANYRVTDSFTTSFSSNTSAASPEEKSLHLSSDIVVELHEIFVEEKEAPKPKPASPRIDTRSPTGARKYFMSAVPDQILPEEIRLCPEGDSSDEESDSDEELPS